MQAGWTVRFPHVVAALGALLTFEVGAQTESQTAAAPKRDLTIHAGRIQPEYPTPYAPASVEEITRTLERVHAYLETAAPFQVIDGATGERVNDLKKLPPRAQLAQTDLLVLSYEWGVTYSGMLLASEVTGDGRYRAYTDRNLANLATLATHVSRQKLPEPEGPFAKSHRGLTLQSMVSPLSLDDSGSMCAAMIKAHRAGVGGNLRPWINNYLDWVSNKQMRLADGTLARNRPLPNSLWLDDLYMSVPALAQAGVLTGEQKYFDDAARQIIQFADRMFVREKRLFMHGWTESMDPHPPFHWGRANGWAVMAMVELLDVMPEQHKDRERVLDIFREHMRGLAAVQGHAGLWHQLLDRPESYQETSASAMFVYGMARGINRGWLDHRAYGPAASLGWNAVAKKVNAQGQVEGTCVGTGMGWDPMFYFYRPVHVLAAHGYGPLFLAGAEMIKLSKGKGALANMNGGLQFDKALSKY